MVWCGLPVSRGVGQYALSIRLVGDLASSTADFKLYKGKGDPADLKN